MRAMKYLDNFSRSAAKRLTAKSSRMGGLTSVAVTVAVGHIPASPLINEHDRQQRSRHLQHLCTSRMVI